MNAEEYRRAVQARVEELQAQKRASKAPTRRAPVQRAHMPGAHPPEGCWDCLQEYLADQHPAGVGKWEWSEVEAARAWGGLAV